LQKNQKVRLPAPGVLPEFCRTINAVPISYSEFGVACRDYPLAFVTTDDGKNFAAVGVLGVAGGENLFLKIFAAGLIEPLPLTTETNVSLPTTNDLDVVGRNVRESQAAQSMVSVSGKLAFAPPPVLSVRSSGLVSPEEMRESGTLEASFEEKQMLANYDTAYARFEDEVPAKPGDKLLIFRPEGPIVHPVSGRTLARQTKTVGVVKVLSIQGRQATVQIERTFEEVERGDRVRPWEPQEKRVAPRANTADVLGRIVQALNPGLSEYGEATEVFIDRGSADGVQEGNTFAVIRQGDGLSNAMVVGSFTAGRQGELSAKADVPEENVGLLLVIDVRDRVSTAVVIKSIRELSAGDFVEMRASGSGGGLQ